MPCVRKSTLSSALAAATATLSSIYAGSPTAPVSTPTAAAQTSIVPQVSSASSSSPAVASSSSSTAAATAVPTSAVPAGSTTNRTAYAGVNIAGFDFGCGTDGTCNLANVYMPSEAAAQMEHFYKHDGQNLFRLPVGWQFLTNNVVGGDLDATNFAKYDELMQSCLGVGAKCILDIHNYARWNGQIIGQGGPTNDEFAALWTSLATKYAGSPNVIFGIMNEPHDLTVSTWADTVQAAVTAIRKVAPDNWLLIPGSSYSSAQALPTEAGPDLLKVKNPDGSTKNIFFDVHRYLDSDGSGTNTECVTNNIDGTFAPLAKWLRASGGRQALLSETGGGNTASCEQNVCEQLAFLDANSDVFLGYAGWAAGGFDASYVLSLTPSGGPSAASMVDEPLMSKCFAR